MKDFLELIGKYVPVPVFVAILAAAASFYGVYFYNNHRSYGDALRDRSFTTLIVVIAGALLIYFIQRRQAPPATQPLLVVAQFSNDQNRQFQDALVSQLEARIEDFQEKRS